MLHLFRQNIKIIIWVIVLSFVAWGAGTFSVSRDQPRSYVGTIDSEKIKHQEFRSTLRFYELLTRANTKATPPSLEEIRSLTWQTLVLSRQAKKDGVKIPDRDVRDRVQWLFFENRAFDHPFYETWIKDKFRGRARDFEEVVRSHIAAETVMNQLLDGVDETNQKEEVASRLRKIFIEAKVEDFSQV
jgi:hypothetical protein